VAAAAVGGFAQGFVLTATPRAGVFTDLDCGPLTLDSTGTRGFTSGNGKGTQALCW
jgi:Tfp pilus assembly protein PilE